MNDVPRSSRFISLIASLVGSILAGASGGFLVSSLDRRSEAEQGELTKKTQRVRVKEHTRERPAQR